MSKSTVVFNTNQVVVEGGKPWLDSEGNEAYPEVIFGSDVSERLEKAEERIKELEAEIAQGELIWDKKIFSHRQAEAENAELRKALDAMLAQAAEHMQVMSKLWIEKR